MGSDFLELDLGILNFDESPVVTANWQMVYYEIWTAASGYECLGTYGSTSYRET